MGWLNTREQISRRIKSERPGYALMEHAEASAWKYVERLAQSICGSEKTAEAHFFEEEGK